MSEKPIFSEDYHSEQTPEMIRQILENAAEKGTWTELTVKGLGENPELSSQRVLPWSFDGEYLLLESEGGVGMEIQLSRITAVQLSPETEQEPIAD